MDSCFDYYHAWFLEDKSEEKLLLIKNKYHDTIYFLLKDMIIRNEA